MMIFSLCLCFSLSLYIYIYISLSLSGVVGTVKAIISESSNDSNQSLGMALIGAAWSLGFVIGPAIAGATADPIGQYNLTISGAYLIM